MKFLRRFDAMSILSILTAIVAGCLAIASPATQPTSQPAKAFDLESALNNAKPNSTIIIPPGIWDIHVGRTSINAANVTVIGAGVTKSTVRFIKMPGATSGIRVNGNDLEFSNVNITSDQNPTGKTKIQITAFAQVGESINLHDVTYGNIDQLAFFSHTGSGIVREAHNPDQTMRSDHYFLDGASNVLIEDCSGHGSWNEHVARVDQNSVQGINSAKNVIFRHCDFVNDMCGKETIALRTALQVTVDNCDLRSWSRVGQVTNPPRLMTVAHATYSNCRFYNRAWLQIDQGTTNTVLTDLTFQNYKAYTPIHVNGPGVHLVGTGTKLVDMDPPPVNHDLVITVNMGPHDVVNVK